MKNLAPIVLFVYNRPCHTEQTLNALMQNELADESVLFIYADGPKENATEEQLKTILEVRRIIRNKQWCREVHIIESEKNKGLADSIIKGVTNVVDEFEKIIVLEDDIITSKGFLKYMNDGLEKYKTEESVMQISGYMFPLNISPKEKAILLPFTTSWGWGTWQSSWKYFDPLAQGYSELKTNKSLSYKFDLDGSYPYTQMLIEQMEKRTISSWAIRWWWTVFKKDGLVLYPDKSLVKNIGFDGTGVNSGSNNPFKHDSWRMEYEIVNYPKKTVIDNNKFLLTKIYLKMPGKEIDLKYLNLLFLKVKEYLNKFSR